MPHVLKPLDALKAKLAGGEYEPEPPRRESPVERAVRDHCKAITESVDKCCEAMAECASAMASATAKAAAPEKQKPVDEEWEIVVTARDGPYAQKARIKRIR